MNQQEKETKLELLEELVESSERYLIIQAEFRTRQKDGVLEIVEFFPNDTYPIVGNFNEESLWYWVNEADQDLGEHLRRVGFYACKMMFVYESDGDGCQTWDWLELEVIRIDNFTPLEIRLKEEFEWSNVVIAESSADDDLPF